MCLLAFDRTYDRVNDILGAAGMKIKKVYATRGYVQVTEIEVE